MGRSVLVSILLLLGLAAVLAGCGGGSNAGASGGMIVSVIFPTRPAGVVPEALPVATNSVRVQVLVPGVLAPIVPDQVLARSGEDPQTATFDVVPVGPCLVRALAYESYDGTGRVIAQAEVLTAIVAGELTQVSLITEALVVRLDVIPATLGLDYLASAALTATCYDADNNVVLATVIWDSSSASVTVAADGTVTGASEGSAVVRATHAASGLSDTCDVTVTRRHVARVVVTPDSCVLRPPDQFQIQLTAVAYDAAGVVVPYAVITWSSDGEPVVTVDQNGLVSTTSADNTHAIITASAGEGTDGTCDVRVAPVGKLIVDVR